MSEEIATELKNQAKNFTKEIAFWLILKTERIPPEKTQRFFLSTREDNFELTKETIEELGKDGVLELVKLSTGRGGEDYLGWDESMGDYLGFEASKGFYYKAQSGTIGKEWFTTELNKENNPNLSEIRIQKNNILRLLKNHQEKRGNGKLLSFPSDFLLIDGLEKNHILDTNWIKMMFLFENEGWITIEDFYIGKKGKLFSGDNSLNFVIKYNTDLSGTAIEKVSLEGGIYYLRATQTFHTESNKALVFPITSKPDQVRLMEYLIQRKGKFCPVKDVMNGVLADKVKVAQESSKASAMDAVEQEIYELRTRMLKAVSNGMGMSTRIDFVSRINSSFRLETTD